MTLALGVLPISRALQQQIRDRGASSSRLSLQLGRNKTFLSRALCGHRPLQVELVFELLHHLAVLPYEFFSLVYPFADNPLVSIAKVKQGVLELEEVPSMDEGLREKLRQRESLSAAEYRLRLGGLVQRELLRKQLPVAAVSRQLGLGSTALGQALRGRSQLTFQHVLGALAVAKVHPGRVFLTLFLPDLEDPIERARLDLVLLALEDMAVDGKQRFLKRRERKAQAESEATQADTPEGARAAEPPAERRTHGEGEEPQETTS